MDAAKKNLISTCSYVYEGVKQTERLDHYLTGKTSLSRSYIKKLISQADILVNNVPVKAGYKLKNADQITILVKEHPQIELKPQKLEFETLYEGEDFAIINKPTNMVVHPSANNWEATLVNGLLHRYKQLSTIGGEFRQGIVHRLDKDTTGLLVIAKTNEFHQHFKAQLMDRQVKRHYLALVHGTLTDQSGIIDAPIGRNPKDRTKMAIVADGRQAITHFKLRETINRYYSIVECRLETGRTHQIRVHLSAINHPIVGDPLYGRKDSALNCSRQMLHSFYLGFVHPQQGWMEFSVRPPQDFDIAIQKARKS